MPRATIHCAVQGCHTTFRPRPENGYRQARFCAAHRRPADAVVSDIDTATGIHTFTPKQPTPIVVTALRRALQQLDAAKQTKTALVEAVYRAARDAASAMSLPPTTAWQRTRVVGTEETAVAVLADWQLGKKTPTYNSDVAAQRMAEYYRALRSIVQIQRADHPVEHLKVFLLGDLVEGELIFPGQAHRIDASLFRQVLVDGPQILGAFLREALKDFATVHVAGVVGNHGRLSWEHHPESNADAMLYEVTRLTLENEERLTWAPNFTAGERSWYALEEVEGHKFFMFHGDQIRGGFAGFPWYGFGKALLPWKVKFGFDYSLSGHFHNPVVFSVGGGTHWGSGTLESDNTWALEELKAWGRPSQWLLFVHPKKGVSAQYEVRLG